MATREVRNKRAKADFRKKIKLEKALSRKLVIQFNKISQTAQKKYNSEKVVLLLAIFAPIISNILVNHYTNVAEIFKQRIDRKGITLTDQEEEVLINIIQKAAETRGRLSASQIIATLQKNLDNSFEKAIEDAKQTKRPVSSRKIASNAIAKFRKTALNRVRESIPITETQGAAEDTKLDAANAHQSSSNNLNKVFKKDWHTIVDGKERPWHNAANRQIQILSEPFNVENGKGEIELLMNPGDISLGATASNIANCRCSMQIL